MKKMDWFLYLWRWQGKTKSPRKENTFITRLWIAPGCFWSLCLKLPLILKIPHRKPFSRQKPARLEGSNFLTRWQGWGRNPNLCALLTWLVLLAAAEEVELPTWFSADCMYCDNQNSWMFLLCILSVPFVKAVVSGYLINTKGSWVLFCSSRQLWLPSR